MSTFSAPYVSLDDPQLQADHFRNRAAKFLLLFLLSGAILFLAMTLRPDAYDEGIVLTAAMRVSAGQLPHKDFYSIYGPAEFYLFAGLFKIFGKSILIERLFDLCMRSLTISVVYTIASQYLRKPIATCLTIATFLWPFGLLSATTGQATIAVGLFNLISTALLIPIFAQPISKWRMFLIGALAGTSSLFRYDTGVALFGIHVLIIAAAIWAYPEGKKLFAFASALWPYVAGFAVVVLPPLLYFLSRSSIHPFLYDIVIYPREHYHNARNLPFPGIGPRSLDNLSIYLPLVIIPFSFFVSLKELISQRQVQNPPMSSQNKKLDGLLLAFALLCAVMYLKGFVRISTIHMYLATIPSLFLIAILFQRRFNFRRTLRFVISILAVLSLLAPVWCALKEVKNLGTNLAFSDELFLTLRDKVPQIRETWCKTESPATRGLCFIPVDGEIQTAEFIDAHTSPNDKLYVGLPKHDKIFANNNTLYFETDRLPATRWSHFDPDLQNRTDIQKQMIQELEESQPPFIILDSEFENVHEPNDSSLSSGVTLLDDYIRKSYKPSQTFGTFTVWKNASVP